MAERDLQLSGKTILITGATGFVGGRLAEYLSLSGMKIRVRGLVHTPSHAVRLARLPVELVYGDITSLDSVRSIVHRCDVIVHCAIGSPYVTIKGTENILKAASEYRVSKVILISSVAVFGYSPKKELISGELEYVQDLPHTGDPYCDSKIAQEKIAIYYHNVKKLPLVILRPSNIFGPYSKPWTIRPVNMLKYRCYCLINGGNTPSNVVYIDNVIDAIILAINEEDAIGKSFIIADERLITWKEFFEAYAKMFPRPPPLLNLSSEKITPERSKQLKTIFREIILHPTKFPLYSSTISESRVVSTLISLVNKPSLKDKIINMASHLPHQIKSRCIRIEDNNNVPFLHKIPDRNLIKIFTSPVHFTSKKANKILGYATRVSFEEGMEITQKWLRYYRLL